MKPNWRFNLYSYEDRLRYAEYLSKEPYNKELDDLLVEFGRKERAMRKQDVRHLSFYALSEAIAVSSPEDQMLSDIKKRIIRECVQNLPASQKRRVVMHYWMGISLAEISRMEGVSKMAISHSINKALKNISSKFAYGGFTFHV